MSDTLVSEEVRVSVAGMRPAGVAPDKGRRSARARTKSAFSQLDENLRTRPLPTVALALALGFVAARVAAAITAR